MLSRSLTNYRDAISITITYKNQLKIGMVEWSVQEGNCHQKPEASFKITPLHHPMIHRDLTILLEQLYVAIYYMIGSGQFSLLWKHQIFKSQIKLTTDACKARHLNRSLSAAKKPYRRRRAFIWINRNTGWSWYIQKTEVPDKWRNGYHIFCGHYWICLLQDVETITSNFGIC